jgi:hypothetical protein
MFTLTSSNTTQVPNNTRIPNTQIRGQDAPARLTRRATGSVKIIGAAAIALLASATGFADAAENSSRTAQEQHACAVTVGLDPSGRSYDICIGILDKSLSEWDQARLIVSDQSACSQKGLQPGTPAFALCVVDAGQSQ